MHHLCTDYSSAHSLPHSLNSFIQCQLMHYAHAFMFAGVLSAAFLLLCTSSAFVSFGVDTQNHPLLLNRKEIACRPTVKSVTDAEISTYYIMSEHQH